MLKIIKNSKKKHTKMLLMMLPNGLPRMPFLLNGMNGLKLDFTTLINPGKSHGWQTKSPE